MTEPTDTAHSGDDTQTDTSVAGHTHESAAGSIEPTAETTAQPVRWRQILISGIPMGMADAVPGVSGGTIALITGIYNQLIQSIHDCIRGGLTVHQRSGRTLLWQGLRFLVPLYFCAAVALVMTVKLMVGAKPEITATTTALELREQLATASGWLINSQSAPIVFGFFFGLVAASMSEPWRARHSKRGFDILIAACGAAASAGLALSPAAAGSDHPAALAAAGALAVSVMLLPGISGSLALLVVGMYQPVAAAVHDRDVVTIAWFGSGMLIGAALFVPLLRWWLQRHHDRTMSVLSGLMAGSLVALWPWKAHYYPQAMPLLGHMQPLSPQVGWWWVIVAALAGAVSIIALTRLTKQPLRS